MKQASQKYIGSIFLLNSSIFPLLGCAVTGTNIQHTAHLYNFGYINANCCKKKNKLSVFLVNVCLLFVLCTLNGG